MPSVVQITDLPDSLIEPLVLESEQDGFRFLRRLTEDWRAGANRFSRTGEAYFGLFDGERLLAIGGINRQSESEGRLRRFYVRKEARRKGYGRMLAEAILAFASGYYATVVARTDTEEADRFYRSIGFVRTLAGGDVTHRIELRKTSPAER